MEVSATNHSELQSSLQLVNEIRVCIEQAVDIIQNSNSLHSSDNSSYELSKDDQPSPCKPLDDEVPAIVNSEQQDALQSLGIAFKSCLEHILDGLSEHASFLQDVEASIFERLLLQPDDVNECDDDVKSCEEPEERVVNETGMFEMLERHVSSTTNEIAELEKKYGVKVEKLQVEYKDLKSQLERLNDVNKDLKDEVKRFYAANEDLKSHSEQLHAANEDLKSHSERLHGDNESLKCQSKRLHSDNEDLKSQSKRLLADNEDLRSQSNQLHADNEDLRCQLKRLHAENEDLKSQSQQFHDCLEKLVSRFVPASLFPLTHEPLLRLTHSWDAMTKRCPWIFSVISDERESMSHPLPNPISLQTQQKMAVDQLTQQRDTANNKLRLMRDEMSNVEMELQKVREKVHTAEQKIASDGPIMANLEEKYLRYRSYACQLLQQTLDAQQATVETKPSTILTPVVEGEEEEIDQSSRENEVPNENVNSKSNVGSTEPSTMLSRVGAAVSAIASVIISPARNSVSRKQSTTIERSATDDASTRRLVSTREGVSCNETENAWTKPQSASVKRRPLAEIPVQVDCIEEAPLTASPISKQSTKAPHSPVIFRDGLQGPLAESTVALLRRPMANPVSAASEKLSFGLQTQPELPPSMKRTLFSRLSECVTNANTSLTGSLPKTSFAFNDGLQGPLAESTVAMVRRPIANPVSAASEKLSSGLQTQPELPPPMKGTLFSRPSECVTNVNTPLTGSLPKTSFAFNDALQCPLAESTVTMFRKPITNPASAAPEKLSSGSQPFSIFQQGSHKQQQPSIDISPVNGKRPRMQQSSDACHSVKRNSEHSAETQKASIATRIKTPCHVKRSQPSPDCPTS